MNGYLIVLRHTMDDLPIRLVVDRAEAIRIAKQRIDFEPTPEVRKVYNTDCSTPVSIVVVEFEDGKPSRIIFERNFEETTI